MLQHRPRDDKQSAVRRRRFSLACATEPGVTMCCPAATRIELSNWICLSIVPESSPDASRQRICLISQGKNIVARCFLTGVEFRVEDSLIFDLIEEFRAPFGDRLVLGMLGRGFQPQLGRHGNLRASVRGLLVRAFHRMWNRSIRWRGKMLTPSRILEQQAKGLAAALSGSGDIPPISVSLVINARTPETCFYLTVERGSRPATASASFARVFGSGTGRRR